MNGPVRPTQQARDGGAIVEVDHRCFRAAVRDDTGVLFVADERQDSALVTGATSGIGRAVALKLARDGAEVLVHGRNAARGAETVKEIAAAGGRASFVAADLTDVTDVQRLASEVGDIDILINNAGISLFAPTAEVDVAAFDKMFASNVRAPFFLVAAFAPGMAARGHGSIVSLSSMAGGRRARRRRGLRRHARRRSRR